VFVCVGGERGGGKMGVYDLMCVYDLNNVLVVFHTAGVCELCDMCVSEFVGVYVVGSV